MFVILGALLVVPGVLLGTIKAHATGWNFRACCCCCCSRRLWARSFRSDSFAAAPMDGGSEYAFDSFSALSWYSGAWYCWNGCCSCCIWCGCWAICGCNLGNMVPLSAEAFWKLSFDKFASEKGFTMNCRCCCSCCCCCCCACCSCCADGIGCSWYDCCCGCSPLLL